VPLLRVTALVGAPSRTVAAALATPGWLSEGRLGDGELAAAGDRFRLASRGPFAVDLCVRAAGAPEFVAEGGRLRVSARLAETAAGTLLTCELRWSRYGERVDMLLHQRAVLALLTDWCGDVRRRALRLLDRRVVVAAAIRDGGRVLAQRRAFPAEVAGRWELPGGRVEDGEDEAVALVRECREELGVEVRVGPRVGPDVPITAGLFLLRAYAAQLRDGEPVAREHGTLRWLTADELHTVDWLPADRALIPPLRRLLAELD